MTSQSTDELKECREAFELWLDTEHFKVTGYASTLRSTIGYCNMWEAWQAAWNRRAAPSANGMTDEEILTDAHRYCCKYVHADEAPYRFSARGIVEFVRLRIARHLSDKEQSHE